ncbi:MAG: uracil-DNA glycosylase [Burkholderiaceae bacterium]|jgi:DNA polymerase|nr:uracil-DNA glycosylase [Burkholderiaceae bacterium]
MTLASACAPPAQNGLRLDKRQCAMLEAMGIVLIGLGRPEGVAAPAASSPAVPPSVPSTRMPAALAVSPDAPDAPDALPPAPPPPASARPAQAVAAPLAASGPAAVPAAAPAAVGIWIDASEVLYGESAPCEVQSGWLVIADGYAPNDPGHAQSSEERRLLDNMMRALGLHQAHRPVHLATVSRGAAPTGDVPHPRPFDEAIPALLSTLAPRVVLALGPLAAQCLLGRSGPVGPIGRLRGSVQTLAAWPQTQVVVSYALSYLLRHGADKAKAWADLCAAAQAFETPGRA